MDNDKAIAAILVAALAFLVVASLGVLTITGYVIYTSGSASKPATDNTPVIDTVSTQASVDTNSVQKQASDTNAVAQTDGTNSDANKEAPPQVQAPPQVTESVAPDIVASDPTYRCYSNFNGKTGLGMNRISLKNNGSADYTSSGTITVSATTGNVSDTITSSVAVNMTIKAGSTLDLYFSNPKAYPDITMSAPFVFLGNGIAKTSVKIDFGNNQYTNFNDTLSTDNFGGGQSC